MRVPWDLVVIDEAHRLRNVYKPDNVVGRTLRAALRNVPKVLLTATPLQNSLMIHIFLQVMNNARHQILITKTDQQNGNNI